MLKADFHIHTRYSMDCRTPLEKIIERCQALGINCLSITDHDSVEGALKMKEIAPFKIIVSEEILTARGEIIGMFLKEYVPGGLSVDETISRIKSQGGLVYIPHPYDVFRPSSIGSVIEDYVDKVDVIEAFNARATLIRSSTQARKLAEKHNIAKSAGSDAHTAEEIGNAYVEMPDFTGSSDFVQALRQGKIAGHRTSAFRRLVSVWSKLK